MIDARTVLGFDTGFFVRLIEGHPGAVAAWQSVRDAEAIGLVSCVTLYELRRLGLKGAMPAAVADELLRQLPHICEVVWIAQPDMLDHAARVAHGNALSMADALILVSLSDAGVRVIYTTDADLARYAGGPEIRRL